MNLLAIVLVAPTTHIAAPGASWVEGIRHVSGAAAWRRPSA